MPLDEQDKNALKQAAGNSIAFGLKNKTKHFPINLEDYSSALITTGASFVTLEINHQLRGCIGSLEANQALVLDVVNNASAAAFKDPRFTALSEEEFTKTDVYISVLSRPELMAFTSEQHLVEQIRPNVDGIILEDGIYRATFLPSVWKSLPDTLQFLQQLKLKAGLPADYWSETISVLNYQCEYF